MAGTFTVSNLSGGTNSGSLYAAIASVNASPGSNAIIFSTNGMIVLSNNLSPISNQVNINGTTAPGWISNPVVTINFNEYSGLVFENHSAGSMVQGLSLVNASNSAITFNDSSNTVFGNFIGMLPDGTTALGNQGDGIFVSSNSFGNIIGSSNTNPTVFMLANIISANNSNGINLCGSSNNQITMNYIGTDITGLVSYGNSNDGILITSNAFGNMIGGPAYGSNNPTGSEGSVTRVFQRPPQGNLISANGSHGVEITRNASSNTLMGNYIGTDTTGNTALGNTGNGILIDNAPSNSILGCFVTNNPFVFYNVVSGNLQNGIKVIDANYTTIQGDFLGVGSSNSKVIPNMGDGLLIAGTSSYTEVGGVIPLGNVISGNYLNGTEIKDTASYCTNYNTFGGGFAFGDSAPNAGDGFLYTSIGSNNIITTCIIGANLGNGIHVSGYATGLAIEQTGIGVKSTLDAALPNIKNGILIDDNAHNIYIGGLHPSIEPRNTISANLGYGIAIEGNANGNIIYHSWIGTDGVGRNADISNRSGGIFLGAGTYNNTIGGDPGINPYFETTINYNAGSGISINSSTDNLIESCSILSNSAYGIIAYGDCSGTLIESNNVSNNDLGNYYLMHSKGITILSAP